MSITRETVSQIAHLARLTIDEADMASYQDAMSRVFKLAAELESVDTHGIAPLAHPLEVDARLRDDNITEFCDDHQLQTLTDHVENNLYLVPKVIEDVS